MTALFPTVKVREDKILVKKRPEERITKSGIIIPDQYVGKRWRGYRAPEEPKEGIVISVGPGRHAIWDKDYDGKRRVPMKVKFNDRIFYDKHTAKEIGLNESEDEYFLMYESAVCFVVTSEGEIKLFEDRVIVKPSIKETYSKNIYVPEMWQDKSSIDKRTKLAVHEGIVIAVGPGVWCTFDEKKSDRYNRLAPMEVKVGDRVIYNKWSVKSMDLYMDEKGKIVKEEEEHKYKKEIYYLLWEASIFGIIE